MGRHPGVEAADSIRTATACQWNARARVAPVRYGPSDAVRIHVLSDLHLEFAPVELPRSTGADVVVLAGDIGPGTRGVELALRVLTHAPVLYIPGNHEFYGGQINAVPRQMRSITAGTHVHVLENDAVEIAGVRFLGCCLWTDFAATGDAPLHQQQAAQVMNDYHHIFGDDGKPLQPADTLRRHQQSRAWLQQQLGVPHPGRTVVVTHYPVVRAAFPRWLNKNPTVVSACVNRLETLLGPPVDLWIHGHTHWGMDQRIHGTRVVSNPRGYPLRPAPQFDPALTVELT